MKNHECRYLYVNEKTATLFGMPKENVIGKLDANILPKKDADRFGLIDRQVLDTGQRYCGEEILLDSDGSQRHYWSVKIPLAKDGKVSSYVGISTDITEVVRLKEKFQLLANTDSLTGTFSRRYLIECAEHELKRMRRSGETMAVIMFDLDRFKSVNDGYGHATGDRAIIAVAEACKKNLREIDWLGRMGGDEFVVVLPDIDLASTLIVAERIREAICATQIWCDDGSNISVTSSFGITMSDSSSSFDELLARSDAALYVAKNRGRNCVWHDQGPG
jgi:diguanylate cyclase (GGDEF)-like protein/PAS domain S-box-containing protein